MADAPKAGVSCNAPNAKEGQQDFIKGWSHPELLTTPFLTASLKESFEAALPLMASALNYGDPANGAHMLGHPEFRQALAEFLSKQYGCDVDWNTLMSTCGASLSTDLCARVHCNHGDTVVVEEPTYYLAHTMFRDSGLKLQGVPIESDGIDLVALTKILEEQPGVVKMVYTIPVHHNPTGVTMSEEKRAALVALAVKHDFKIIADEAYQLLSFEETGKPLFYHDDPANPRVFSIGTFSKLIGPGIKIGWVHAHPALLKPLTGIGFIDSGNNIVTWSSCALIHFLRSGNLAKHIEMVCATLGKKCHLLRDKLREVGLEPNDPKGGYFVWCESKGKSTGRSGKGMAVDPPDRFEPFMRLCFAWLTEAQIVDGVEYLRE